MMNKPAEIWKPIIKNYQISNYGNLRKVNKTNEYDKRTPKYSYIKGTISKFGYKRVFLSINNEVKTFAVHRLVAEAFLDKNNFKYMPNENKNLIDITKLVVNHKDENKLNNFVDNLEWCTTNYNNNYGTHNEKTAKGNYKKINQYDLKGNLIKKWNSLKEAGETLNICKNNISSCASKRYKTTGGFIWEYDYD